MPTMVNGQEVAYAEPVSENMLYCTVTAIGLGDGSSWDNACTFRTAVSRLASGKQNTIFLGAGIHDTDNGADPNGTTISVDCVTICGFGETNEIGQQSQLANKAATATYVLRTTGNKFCLHNVALDNSAQTDTNVTLLNLRGSYNTVTGCVFRQAVADTVGTGILMDNSSVSHTIENCRFRRIKTYAMNYGATQRVYVNYNIFWQCAIAMYASSAAADGVIFRDNHYINCTTAIDIGTALASATGWYSINAHYANNTTNFAALSVYGGAFFAINSVQSKVGRALYPVGTPGGAATTGGIQIAKDAATWTWGDIIEIIPINTINKPFKIAAICAQSWSAAQIFRLELFYGQASPGNISIGIFEFILGDTASGKISSMPVDVGRYIPARAAVGARIMTSTAGADNVYIALAYEPLG